MCNTECVLKGEGKQLGSENEEALHRRLHTEGRERCGGDGWGRLMGKEGGKECRRVNDEAEEGDGGRDGMAKEKEKGKNSTAKKGKTVRMAVSSLGECGA